MAVDLPYMYVGDWLPWRAGLWFRLCDDKRHAAHADVLPRLWLLVGDAQGLVYGLLGVSCYPVAMLIE